MAMHETRKEANATIEVSGMNKIRALTNITVASALLALAAVPPASAATELGSQPNSVSSQSISPRVQEPPRTVKAFLQNPRWESTSTARVRSFLKQLDKFLISADGTGETSGALPHPEWGYFSGTQWKTKNGVTHVTISDGSQERFYVANMELRRLRTLQEMAYAWQASTIPEPAREHYPVPLNTDDTELWVNGWGTGATARGCIEACAHTATLVDGVGKVKTITRTINGSEVNMKITFTGKNRAIEITADPQAGTYKVIGEGELYLANGNMLPRYTFAHMIPPLEIPAPPRKEKIVTPKQSKIADSILIASRVFIAFINETRDPWAPPLSHEELWAMAGTTLDTGGWGYSFDIPFKPRADGAWIIGVKSRFHNVNMAYYPELGEFHAPEYAGVSP